MRSIAIACVIVTSLASQARGHNGPTDLKIGAFQIDVFGTAKGNKPEVMEVITKIVADYDIILIQDIRQASEEIFDDLLALLNLTNVQFNYVKSARLGRSSSKAQYAYYYNAATVEVLGTHQYEDVGDVFEREPLSIHIKPKKRPSCVSWGLTKLKLALSGRPLKLFTRLDSIVLIGIQARPDDVINEIKALNDVYNDVKEQFGTNNVIVLGNMVAGCQFASETELATTRLFSDTATFTSLISSDNDTTTSGTDCAYDRILVSNGRLASLVYKSGIQIPEDDPAFNITNAEMQDVSNHYPVFVDILVPCKLPKFPRFWGRKRRRG